MGEQPWRSGLLVMMLVTGYLAGCAGMTGRRSTPVEMPQGEGVVWDLVVIGDSSFWGLGDALADQIEAENDVKVELHDYATGNLSAGVVLRALSGEPTYYANLTDLPQVIAEAEVVVLWANPEESIDPQYPLKMDGCFYARPPSACPPEAFEIFTHDLDAIWGKIITLRSGKPFIARATDLYNPLISLWEAEGVTAACDACWLNLSNAARRAAEQRCVPFFSRYDAFNGTDHRKDPRQLDFILSDGEHPSHLANQATARWLAEMGYDPLVETCEAR